MLVVERAEMPLALASPAVPVLVAEGIIEPAILVVNLRLRYLFMAVGAVPTIRSAIRNRRFVDLVYRLGHPPVEL